MASEKKDSHLTEHISEDIEITGTVQEFDGLRRVAEKIPTGAWFIVVTEFCERFAYYGGSAPFQSYVQFPPGDDKGQAGALGRGQATATALSVCRFSSYTHPVLPHYSIVAPLCADQFKTTTPVVKSLKSGERVLVDYELSIQHLYQWFYWAINTGALIGGIACPLIELNYSYWAAYLLRTRMFAMAIVVFIAGNKFYIKPNPTKSILIKVFKVFRVSRKVAKRPENKAARSACKYPFDFAKPENGMKNSALLTQEDLCQIVWDDTFVEELKTTIMACKIFHPSFTLLGLLHPAFQ